MEQFYLVRLNSLPRIFMAHRYSSDKYDFSFGRVPNTLEISYSERGSIVHCFEDGMREEMQADTFYVNFYDYALHSYSTQGNSHVTAGIAAPDIEIRPLKPEEMKNGESLVSDGRTAIIPRLLSAQNAPLIKELLYKTVTAHTVGDAMLCSAYVMQMFSAFTRAALADCSNISPAGEVYAIKAQEYVAHNLHRQITMKELAADLGISYGYLSVLFRNATGQTVIEYVNRKKIERVAELMREKDMSLAAAGELVGIIDENYLCRLFKTYMGMTVHEFRASLAQKVL